jgi:hypothetical protein
MDFLQDLTASIIRVMMEAVSFSETLVSIYQTAWFNIPEDSHLHTCCHENLKSHNLEESLKRRNEIWQFCNFSSYFFCGQKMV